MLVKNEKGWKVLAYEAQGEEQLATGFPAIQ